MCTKKEPNLEDSVDQVSPLTLQSKVPKDVADGEEHRSPTHDQSLDELLTEANRKWNDVYGDVSPHVSSKKVSRLSCSCQDQKELSS